MEVKAKPPLSINLHLHHVIVGYINTQSLRVGSTPTPTCQSGQGGFAKADVALGSNKAEAVLTLRMEVFMPVSNVLTELITAYMGTVYRAFTPEGEIVLRIGEPSDPIAQLMRAAGAKGAAFITAENPFSEQLSASENHDRQKCLRHDLALLGATVFDGEGQGDDPAWPAETSYLAIGVTCYEARDLGIKYQQNAIVYIDATGTPELLRLR